MILNQSERVIVEQSVISTFTEAGILAPSNFPSPLRFATESDSLKLDWVNQWQMRPPKGGDLGRAWNWRLLNQYTNKKNIFMVGWYQSNSLLALCNMNISTSQDNPKFIEPSVAIHLIERRQSNDWFKGLARPFFYETARQIALLKGIENMHVLGSYFATDQDDFDLYFGMKSDQPEKVLLKDCLYRTRKCSEPFNWNDLPHYKEMLEEKAQAAKQPAPTPAI